MSETVVGGCQDAPTDDKAKGRRPRRPVDVHVGMKIRDRRRLMNISRNDLARALGLSIQQIQKYESGDSTVAASRLHQIGRELGVPPSYFFDNMPPAIQGSSPLIPTPLPEGKPGAREIRQMIQVYRGIASPELRHQIYELASCLSQLGIHSGIGA